MKQQKTTVADVAALAGVSPMTVSRALSKKHLVKEKTLQKVAAAVKQLNYRPNAMARGLASGDGMFIGLIYDNPSYGYLSEMLRGALDACRERGHYLIVDEPFTRDDLTVPEPIENRFLDTTMQAVIVMPPLSSDTQLAAALKECGIDCTLVSPRRAACEASTVSMDDKAAASEMTDYLVGLGHRRIGFIRGQEGHVASELRLEAFRETMSRHGLEAGDEMLGKGRFTYRSGMEAAAGMLDLSDPPTAIFAANDDMAAGAVAAALKAGLSVPDDISIVGFDDTENARQVWPPLTTIRQPIREMARQAVAILERHAEQAEPDRQQLVLKHELLIRESAAPPKNQSSK